MGRWEERGRATAIDHTDKMESRRGRLMRREGPQNVLTRESTECIFRVKRLERSLNSYLCSSLKCVSRMTVASTSDDTPLASWSCVRKLLESEKVLGRGTLVSERRGLWLVASDRILSRAGQQRQHRGRGGYGRGREIIKEQASDKVGQAQENRDASFRGHRGDGQETKKARVDAVRASDRSRGHTEVSTQDRSLRFPEERVGPNHQRCVGKGGGKRGKPAWRDCVDQQWENS